MFRSYIDRFQKVLNENPLRFNVALWLWDLLLLPYSVHFYRRRKSEGRKWYSFKYTKREIKELCVTQPLYIAYLITVIRYFESKQTEVEEYDDGGHEHMDSLWPLEEDIEMEKLDEEDQK